MRRRMKLSVLFCCMLLALPVRAADPKSGGEPETSVTDELLEEKELTDDLELPKTGEDAEELLDDLEKISESVQEEEVVKSLLEHPVFQKLIDFFNSLVDRVFRLLFDFIEGTD